MNENFKDIVKSAISGDESAFEALYTMTKDSAYFIALSMTHNEQDALDILQESYIKAFSNLNKVDPPELFDNWFNRIVANCSKDFLKQKKPILFSSIPDNVVIEDLEEETSPELIPHEFVDKQEASRLIMQIINGLPENKRLVILMYYYQNMSINEIADSLGVPVSTVKYYLSAGRKEIKTELEKLDKEGTRLYAVIPFALFPSLIGQAAENVNAPVFSSVSAKIMKNVNSDISNPHITSSESQSQTNLSSKANGGKNMFFKTTIFKIIVSAVAGAVIGGGTMAVIMSNNKQEPATDVTSIVEQPADTAYTAAESTENQPADDTFYEEQISETVVSTENQPADDTLYEDSTGYSELTDSSETTENSGESPASDFRYEEHKDYIKIQFYRGNSETIVIPEKINNKPVTTICESSFRADSIHTQNYLIKSITLPNTVTTIGSSAFAFCESLEYIYIPESVTEIIDGTYGAFEGCESLTIHGKSGSAAESYAKENNIPFVAE